MSAVAEIISDPAPGPRPQIMGSGYYFPPDLIGEAQAQVLVSLGVKRGNTSCQEVLQEALAHNIFISSSFILPSQDMQNVNTKADL